MDKKLFLFSFGVFLTLVALLCGGIPTAQANSGSQCSITSFTAATSNVISGGSTTLYWTATNDCIRFALTSTNGIYSNTPVSGTSATTGTITSATTFTLTAYDTNGISTPSGPITIYPTNSNSGGGTCTITSFYPYSSSLSYGGNTALSWMTTGTCVSLSIDNGIGAQYSIASGSANTSGLTATTTFTLTAVDANGSTTNRQTIVSVSPNYYNTGSSSSTGCTITSFYAEPAQINYLGTSTLYWNSYGCNSITIPGIGNSNNPNGSVTTSGLYYTTTFDIYGFGNDTNSVMQSTTINVAGNNQPYYASNQYNNTNSNSTNATVTTTVATNIGTTTVRLNGLVTSITPTSAYFEYGTTPSLGQTTPTQYVSGTQTNYYTGITVSPLTTYYYRADISANGQVTSGNIVSFTTQSENSEHVTYYGDNTNGGTNSENTATSGTGTSSTAGVTLTITNKSDKINVGDTVEDTIIYTNGTGKNLSDAILTVVLPAGLTATQASQGRITSPNTVEVDLGTLVPEQTGSVFIEASVNQNVQLAQTLVTTGTLNFTLPSGTRDSAVGYILNHAGSLGSLGGIALGDGFFPTTIFGWLVTILIILVLILVARRISRSSDKHAAPGHH